MVQINTRQARQRFSIIMSRLQDAVFSDQNAEIVARTAGENHLDEDKVTKLLKVVGWVLLGFIHLEDFAKELADQIGIPAQTAANISNSLNAKIFQPLKGDLDKVYAPAPPEGEAEKPKAPPGLPVFITAPAKISEGNSGGQAAAQPLPATTPKPTAGPTGEFARLRLEKKATPAGEPPPKMIFGAGEAKPSEAASKFKMEMPPLPKLSEVKTAAPPRPAVIEFGGARPPEPAKPATPLPQQMPKVVHYTEFRTELPRTEPIRQAQGEPPPPAKISPPSPGGQVPKPPASPAVAPRPPISAVPPTPPPRPMDILAPKKVEPPPLRRPVPPAPNKPSESETAKRLQAPELPKPDNKSF